MIPFQLFKYIYCRNIVYFALMGIIMRYIFIFLFGLTNRIAVEVQPLFYLLNVFLMIGFVIILTKYIMKELVFRKYKRITIGTKMQCISINFVLMFLFINLLSIIPIIGFYKLNNIIFCNGIILATVNFSIRMFIEYCVLNVFLSKYITVSKNKESTDDNNV